MYRITLRLRTSRSQVRPDVSEKSKQPNVAKKSKLELKGTDPDTSQTQIGEKSTATLKGNAVIVGDDDASSEDNTGGGQRASNADLNEQADLTGKGGSPEPGTIPGRNIGADNQRFANR